jgi:hypothetical protein
MNRAQMRTAATHIAIAATVPNIANICCRYGIEPTALTVVIISSNCCGWLRCTFNDGRCGRGCRRG